MTDEKTAAMTIAALLREPAFSDAIAYVANAEADKHLKDMRRYIREEEPQRAALSEARAQEWETALIAFKEFVRKYENGTE